MKNEKRKSIPWLMGGLAALIFLGSGSLAAAQVVTSYNDLAWGTGQLETNITKITSPTGGSVQPSTGQLVDFSTGNPIAVTLTVTGGLFDGDPSATQGADPTTGDAFDIFAGKVNGLGVLSYINMADSDLVLTFTNMVPGKVYDLTLFSDRDRVSADDWDRASLVTISGQDFFVNTSSVATDNPNEGGGVLFTGATDTSTRLPSDNDNGYVARFSNIKSGSDGQVVLTISFDGSVGEQFKGKYASALRLIESGIIANDIDGDVSCVQEEIWGRGPGLRQHGISNGCLISATVARVADNPGGKRRGRTHSRCGQKEMVRGPTALLHPIGRGAHVVEIGSGGTQPGDRHNMILSIGIGGGNHGRPNRSLVREAEHGAVLYATIVSRIQVGLPDDGDGGRRDQLQIGFPYNCSTGRKARRDR